MTDLEAFKEIGCVQFENAIILDLDMKNIPIDKITKKWATFKYEPPFTEWHKYLSKSTYNPNEEVEVVCKHKYFDIKENKSISKGTRFKCPQSRASYLEVRDLVEIL